MIQVENLSRRFGSQLAVSGATFEVEKGAILGFLGLNGAGKSTTMRMLTCFLRPSGGTARVGGHDIRREPLAVRRLVGYLPESNPLYTEMRVHEYLAYRAALKGVEARSRKAAIGSAMDRCGLVDVQGKVIGHLSRGYRQRVGLADALVHDPEVLILDEPTVGLDPSQIRQVRSMIRDLAEKHTVVLSTHILQEVEAVCDRVIIIESGRIVLRESLEALQRGMASAPAYRVEVRGEGDLAGALGALPGVRTVEADPAGGSGGGFEALRLEGNPGADPREGIFRAAVEKGWTIRELSTDRRTLEDIFMEITVRGVPAATSAAPVGGGAA